MRGPVTHGALVASLLATAFGRGHAAAPITADAPPVTTMRTEAPDTTLLSYVVDSVRVIQRLSSNTEVVAVNVYLLGGSRQLTPESQGVEAMLLAASRYGTRGFADTTLRVAWNRTGSSAVSEMTRDWTMLGFRGVVEEFDRSWDIVIERLTVPTLTAASIDVARDRQLSMLRRLRASRDGEIAYVADSVVFDGHPYGLSPYGTPTSLARLDSAAVASYVRAQVVRSRMLVVVAGAASRAMVEAAIRRTLGGVPVGSYTWTAPTPRPPRPGTVTLLPRTTATSYVIGVYDGPPPTSDEYPAFRLATEFLSQLMTTAVREKRGLSYAASAYVDNRALPTGLFYVSTTRPDTVLRLIKRQLDNLRNPDSLPSGMTFTNEKNSLTNLFRRSTSAAQVEALANAAILEGDHRLVDNVPYRARSVSSSNVRRAAIRYMQNFQVVYAGDTTLVKRASFEGLSSRR